MTNTSWLRATRCSRQDEGLGSCENGLERHFVALSHELSVTSSGESRAGVEGADGVDRVGVAGALVRPVTLHAREPER
jgi:hypothetical protein